MINSKSIRGNYGKSSKKTSSSAYQNGETIIEEDEDTIVTRTIETRPVRRNNTTAQMTYSSRANFTSPSRNLNPVIITGAGSSANGPATNPQTASVSLRQSMANVGVLASPSRYNVSRKFVRGGMNGGPAGLVQAPRFASPPAPIITGMYKQNMTQQNITQQNQENVDYITTETITTRKKKGTKKYEKIRRENEKLKEKIQKLQGDMARYKHGGSKTYVLEKENADLKLKLNSSKSRCKKLEDENDQLRMHLAVKNNTNINIPQDDGKWKFIKKEIERLSDELKAAGEAKKKSDKNYLDIKSHNLKLASENNRLVDKVNDLSDELEKERMNSNMFRDKMGQLQINNLTLQNTVDGLSMDINKYQNQPITEDLSPELNNMRSILENEKDKNMELNKQLADALAQIQVSIHLEENNRKLNAELDDKVSQYNMMREEYDNLSNERDNLLMRIDELEKVKPEDAGLMDENRNEIADLRDRCDQYEGKIGEMEIIIDQLEAEKKEVIDEFEILKSEYLLLEGDFDKLKSEHEDDDTLQLIKDENESLKRLNEQIRMELENSRGRPGKSNEFSELSKKLSDLENKLTKDSNSHELVELKARNRELEGKIKNFEKKERRWNALQKDLQTIKEEFNNDKMLIINLTRDKEDLQKGKKQLEGDLKKKSDLARELENEVDEWKNKCFHLEKRLELGDDENQNLHYIEEIEGLKQMIEEKEEELRLWQNEVRRLEEEIGHIEDGEDNIHELGGRIGALEEEIKLLSDENDRLRQDNEDLNAKLESAEEVIQDNENLRELLRQLRSKLSLQLESNDKIWKLCQRELELKMKLKEEINTKITLIKREATGETSEAARYYQQEISKIHAENERLHEENEHMQSRIDELKEEVQILRDEHMEHHVMQQDGEEEMDDDMTN